MTIRVLLFCFLLSASLHATKDPLEIIENPELIKQMTEQAKTDFVKSLALPKYSYNNAVIGFIKDCIISCWTIMPTTYPLHKPEFKTPKEIIGVTILQIVRTEFAHKYMLENTAYKIALDLITSDVMPNNESPNIRVHYKELQDTREYTDRILGESLLKDVSLRDVLDSDKMSHKILYAKMYMSYDFVSSIDGPQITKFIVKSLLEYLKNITIIDEPILKENTTQNLYAQIGRFIYENNLVYDGYLNLIASDSYNYAFQEIASYAESKDMKDMLFILERINNNDLSALLSSFKKFQEHKLELIHIEREMLKNYVGFSSTSEISDLELAKKYMNKVTKDLRSNNKSIANRAIASILEPNIKIFLENLQVNKELIRPVIKEIEEFRYNRGMLKAIQLQTGIIRFLNRIK